MMKENIYQLLNEVETDFREYEQTELSQEERERHKQHVLMEVRRMDNKAKRENKKGKVWKIAAGMAAACAVAVGVTSLANPVLAKEIFGGLFGNLIENAQGEKYEKEDTERYTKIGKSAVTVQDEVEKQQKQDGYVTTVENNGVTVSVSDVYCDGYVLYYTASVKTDHEGLKQADGMITETKEGRNPSISIDGTELSGYSSKAFDKSKDGSFTTICQVDLMAPADNREQPLDLKVDEKGTLTVDWELKQFVGYLWDQWEEPNESGECEYKSTGKVEGNWHLRFPVTVDRSVNETFDINKEENGITVKKAVKTKAGLVVEVELPDFTKAPYNDPYNDPDMGIKDSEGNWLQWMNQNTEIHEDGTSTMQIMVLYDGEKDLSFDVTAKDEDLTPIASIGFQIP